MAEITTCDITVGQVDGDGVFDQLMKSMSANLEQEFAKQRIRGPDYAKVYLGGMEAAMSQAIAFLLGRQKADKEADLIAAQILLTEKQREKIDEEILLLQEQVLKITAEIVLINAQKDAVLAKTTPEVNVLIAQKNKLDAEEALLNNKTTSESYQYTAGAAPGSVLGEQVNLRQKQAEGFLRDAEQKLSKIAADAYAVQRTTDDTLSPPSSLAEASIDAIMGKAKTGIGV